MTGEDDPRLLLEYESLRDICCAVGKVPPSWEGIVEEARRSFGDIGLVLALHLKRACSAGLDRTATDA